MEELRASVGIILYCLNKIPSGEVKTINIKLTPSKNLTKRSMEATIYHFKAMSSGLALPVN